MSCTKECADLVTMFVELLQGEWQSKYDLLKELHEKDATLRDHCRSLCELKRENKELRQKLEKLLSRESNRLFDIVENPDAESEVSDAEDADAPEPEIIEDVPSLMD